MKKLILGFIVSLSVLPAQAAITQAGKGVLMGTDHAFAFTAKKDWVLDNQSGVKHGLHMLFYPKNKTLKNSKVMMYGRAVLLSRTASIEEQVQFTVNDFRRHGSPKYKAKYIKTMVLNNGKKANIYHFSGDQWGNHEAAAYIKEKETINYLVFHAKTKADFDKNLPVFNTMVQSYQNLYVAPVQVNLKKINRLQKQSEKQLKNKVAKQYEIKVAKAGSQAIANSMKTCFSALPKNKQKPFKYYAVIGEKGDLVDSVTYPASYFSGCFSQLMATTQFPLHQLDEFIFILDMKIAP